jgi:hypothetical protein
VPEKPAIAVDATRAKALVEAGDSRTLFFNDKGTQRGMTADAVREFAQYLNRKYAKRLNSGPAHSAC